ncbi:hypothetical protein [Blastopirellula marina]|uniref:Uncharacterized protein n=1 Tax=Blastopirellula marina TaxID=124 RepID=A0A2S8FD83_9BACT|nr:hypothetical protein [Blastopirellula marina]PQO30116.1 hypothetical protein C5Y98_21435 [Blastopirellula marina]PTL42554.1 hypothetical protein C5Y97_21445 [Blastopirellula marina]
MPLNRPPLMSRGQANDFYSYTAIGTGLMWLAGGLAAGPAALALGLCGAGAIANNRRSSGRNAYNPQMIFQPPNMAPPGPLDRGLPPEAMPYVNEVEGILRSHFGENAVHCYRQMVLEGYTTKDAYETLYKLLAALREQGYWDKGQILSGQLPPKQLLDQVTGRRVASPELQQYFHPDYFPGFYQGVVNRGDKDGHYLQDTLVVISLWIYILGLTPITNTPVRRIKVWWDRISHLRDGTSGHPFYFVADWDWFVEGTVEQIRERWDWLIFKMMRDKHGMPQHLIDECEDLWHYRVEPHRGDAPPGHPGGVLISSVLFGRTKSFSATEEDMRGMP